MLAGRGRGVLDRGRCARVKPCGEQALEGDRPTGLGLLGPRYPASGEGSLNGGPTDATTAGGLGCGPAGALAGGLLGHLLGLLGALLAGHGSKPARSLLGLYSGAPD